MIGTSLLHYDITAHLGSGGMGDVYRATDSTLRRDVAIKVLPAELSEDPERVARFEREARTLAAFHHSNIAAIHGFEQDKGRRFLVMEFVQGENLQTVLERGPLPVDEAIDTARQIAEGLEAAHERGIVHRDLKPANVVRSADGTVKILDFGLARAYSPDEGEVDLENSPTITAAMTQAGTILGTAAYMSPEQARGKGVDKRVDIWSFGVILMEMLTGRRLFEGETVSDTMAGVLKSDIDLDALPAGTPSKVRALLARCLDRDPKTRLRDIGEARVMLSAPFAEPAREASSGTRLPWLLGGLAVGAVVSFFLARALAPSDAPTPSQPVRFEINVPNAPEQVRCAFSSDGARLVFNDADRLYVRHLDDPVARPIPNTEGATIATWSPDGQWIAFCVGVQIFKIQPDGSRRFLICEVDDPLHPVAGSLSWQVDDHIVIVQGDHGLLRVPAAGGSAETWLPPGDDELDFHAASALPGGKGILFGPHAEGVMNTIDLFDDAGRKTVHTHSTNSHVGWPSYSAGHLLYVARVANPGVWAVPYSIADRATTGEAFLLVPDGNLVEASVNGNLAYSPDQGERSAELLLVDREGRTQRTLIAQQAGLEREASVSPDGTQIAVAIRGDDADIWVYEVANGNRRRVIFGEGLQLAPVWAPDGRSLAYAVGRFTERRPLLRDLSQGTDTAISELSGQDFSFSADQRFVAYGYQTSQLDWNIAYTDLTTGEATPIAATLATEQNPALSPDGRTIAFEADDTGTLEIYLQRFPEAGERWRVSNGGGEEPFWSADGSALYFRSRTTLMEVELTTSPGLVLGEPRKVFQRDRMDWVGAGVDGGFLVNELAETTATGASIVVWTDWVGSGR